MAPKQASAKRQPLGGRKDKSAKASGSTQLSAATDQPEEEQLVAVILADSYDDLYAPLTVDTPRCLLPLANVPLINYSIESAARTGAAHIYVLSSSHTQRIRDHIGLSASKGTQSLRDALAAQDITITVIGTPEARSEGDALRELDAKQILRSDFLLYRCDSIVTTDLKPLVQLHRERRKTDKDAIMTTVCMSSGSGPESHALQAVHYIDPATQQVLHYEMTSKHGESSRNKLVMPLELLRLDEKTGYDDIDVRCDLIEAGVDICSIDVPPLFSENFDYQSFSKDFVPGILTSDLLESKIFMFEARDGYAGRAQDTQAYHTISADILLRKASPFAPNSTSWLEQSIAEEQQGPARRYISSDAHIDGTSHIASFAIIAASCSLSEGSCITNSVIGNSVSIGQHATIINSHIHPRAHIGAGANISSSIVGDGAQIYERVLLGPGCIIGPGCAVGPRISLPPGTRIGSRSRASWEDDEEDEAEDVAASKGLLGQKGRGFLWPNKFSHSQEGEESDEDGDEEPISRQMRSIGFLEVQDESRINPVSDEESVSSLDEDSDINSDSEDEEAGVLSSGFSHVAGMAGVTDLTLGGGADSKIETAAASNRLAEFDAEARASMARALAEGYSSENAVLELKTLRMASNVSPREVQRIAVETFLVECKPGDGKQVQSTVKRWQRLLTAIAAEDEVEALTSMQSYCADHNASYGTLFVPLVKLFYNEDIVSDEAVVAWWRSKAAQSGGEAMLELRRKASDIVRYILEDSDEDEESDDGE